MKIHVVRKEDSVDVLLIKHKDSNMYSYVNLTKGHICSCRFECLTDSIEDLRSYPRVKNFIIQEMFVNEMVEYVLEHTGSHGYTVHEDHVSFSYIDSSFTVSFNEDGSYLLGWNKVYRHFENADDFIKTFHDMFDEVLYEVKGVC